MHIVFPIPSLLNEWLNKFVLTTLCNIISKCSRCEINTFCKNISFGSSNVFSYKLYLGQASHLHLYACPLLSHIFPCAFSQLGFEGQNTSINFLTFEIACVYVCVLNCALPFINEGRVTSKWGNRWIADHGCQIGLGFL